MDRRLFNRIEIPGATVQFKRAGSAKIFVGLSKPRAVNNISKSGLSFDVNKKLEFGDQLHMKINFPDGKNLDLKGHIRWKNNHQSNPAYKVGIQFSPYGTSANYNSLSALDYLRSMDGQELERFDKE